MHVWTFFSAVDLIQHKYLDIYIYANNDKSAINYIYTSIYLNPALKPMEMASTGKSFGLKLYIHSMTDNFITTGTSNYIQLLLNEPPWYNRYIVESGVKHHKSIHKSLNYIFCSSSYRILLQIIQYLYIQYFCHVRICIMIIGVPDFLYCCILLIMVLCHGRSPIKKNKTMKQ